MTNLSLIAIPGVLLLILFEYFSSGSRRKSLYEFRDSVANISHGIFERFAYIVIGLLYYFPYKWIEENFGLFQIETSIISWVLLIVFMDFCWYWYHRTGHTINFMWASHIVHHQSEHFNISAGARITAVQSVYRFIFYLVIPLMGFPVEMIMSAMVFQGTYALLTHTQLIGKLGWLEYIFVTPSHHRVHHANNDIYLDKNYGNLFIFWDYIFGTFQKEEETPTYGLTKQIQNFDFLYGNFHYFMELYYAVKAQTDFKSKLKVFFGSPTLLTGNERTMVDRKLNTKPKRKKGELPFFLKLNIQLRLLGIIALSSVMVGYHKEFDTDLIVYSAIVLFCSFYQLGKIMEFHKLQLITEGIIMIFSLFVVFQAKLILIIPLLYVFFIGLLSIPILGYGKSGDEEFKGLT